MANWWGNNGSSDRLYFLELQNHCRWWLQPWNQKLLAPWQISYDQPREHIKKQRHYFANKGLSNQGYSFSSSHVRMWELDYKESWEPKNCGVGEDSWESLGLQRDQTSQSWRKTVLNIIGRTDVEAETPILWPPDSKNWILGKDPDAGKDWGQEEKGTTEESMLGWNHWLDGHEFEQAPGAGDGQRSLACYRLWGRKVSDTTGRLNWADSLFT